MQTTDRFPVALRSARVRAGARLIWFPAVLVALAAVLGLDCGSDGPLDGDSTGTIVGEVTLDGVPRTGAAVTLSQDGGVVAMEATDAGGDYAFPDLDPGTYRVEVAIPGADCPGGRTVVVGVAQSTVNFACSTPGALLGNLSGLAFGAVGFTVLVVRDPSGTVAAQTVVGAGGEFNVSGLAAGSYVVRLLPSAGSTVSCQDVSTEVPSGGTATVNVVCS